MDSCLNSTWWLLRQFSWYLGVLTASLTASLVLASGYARVNSETIEDLYNLLDIPGPTIETTRLTHAWTLRMFWTFSGVLLAGCAFNIGAKYYLAVRRYNYSRGLTPPPEDRARNFLFWCRLTLNTVHLMALLECVLIVSLAGLQGIIASGFLTTQRMATEATTLAANSEPVVTTFAKHTSQWLDTSTSRVSAASDLLNSYCNAFECDAPIAKAAADLVAMKQTSSDLSKALGPDGVDLCPSTACINRSLLWFLPTLGCICDAESISAVAALAEKGEDESCMILVFLGAAFASALLLVSKLATMMKALLKDATWMRRVKKMQSGARSQQREAFESVYSWDHSRMSLPGTHVVGKEPGLPHHLTMGNSSTILSIPAVCFNTVPEAPRTREGEGGSASLAGVTCRIGLPAGANEVVSARAEALSARGEELETSPEDSLSRSVSCVSRGYGDA